MQASGRINVTSETNENIYSIWDPGFRIFLSPLFRDHFSNLTKQVTLEEVRAAIFQLKTFKASRHDGKPTVVFHKYWSFM